MSRNIAAILRTVELAKAQRVKRNHTTMDMPAPVVDPADEDYASFKAFYDDYERIELHDCKAVTPGLVKVSAMPEPRSIYSPAPPSRIKFERPRKRAIGNRNNDRDCELPPDLRKRQTLSFTSGHSVYVDHFAKRIGVKGPGFK